MGRMGRQLWQEGFDLDKWRYRFVGEGVGGRNEDGANGGEGGRTGEWGGGLIWTSGVKFLSFEGPESYSLSPTALVV
ncbi:hypothetical protein BGX38DRAFT_1271980 [Terfezia claveryi]|nr:hypothetical protein BGX38DRAFT_1271980 [Terfezia claveryi]